MDHGTRTTSEETAAAADQQPVVTRVTGFAPPALARSSQPRSPNSTPAHGCATFSLAPEQVRYFDRFGYLLLKDFFSRDVERIRQGFEDVVAQAEWRVSSVSFYEASRTGCEEVPRIMVPSFLERSPKLAWIRDDPSVRAITRAVLGTSHEYGASDGNLFNCDVSWHHDGHWAGGRRHIKLLLYLDPLTGASGALRVVPGSHLAGASRSALCQEFMQPPDQTSLGGRARRAGEFPAQILPIEPGDLIVLDFRTFHASFNGAPRRRLIEMNFGPRGTRLGEAMQIFVSSATRVATPQERQRFTVSR